MLHVARAGYREQQAATGTRQASPRGPRLYPPHGLSLGHHTGPSTLLIIDHEAARKSAIEVSPARYRLLCSGVRAPRRGLSPLPYFHDCPAVPGGWRRPAGGL
jgi:hypothetical protein